MGRRSITPRCALCVERYAGGAGGRSEGDPRSQAGQGGCLLHVAIVRLVDWWLIVDAGATPSATQMARLAHFGGGPTVEHVVVPFFVVS